MRSKASGSSAKRPTHTACSARIGAAMLTMTAKGDRQPAVNLPKPFVPVQRHLFLRRAEAPRGRLSLGPRQDLLQAGKELLPAELCALIGLLLIAPEARLLHAQVRPRARRRESPGDDTLETHRVPFV
jgi:hypothetical protein